MAKLDKPRANPALRLALIRRIHGWLGLFIAPSVMFFALTGAYQLYGLHETQPGYQPAPLVEKLGRVHMKQTFELKPKRAPAPVQAGGPAQPKPAAKPEDGPKLSVAILKALFLVVAIALAAATILGVWMALTYGRDKRLGWILLVAGAVAPVLLITL
ncbi:MAG: hypothetical protein B7Z44_18715 [Caulobacter sp. 12-67-6]|nr:MAG: hypothetical protein B7Z44_18715 [Caulobacter sp. 12-67-6]OYX71863.1 MAG: hypothetical protein B7Y81_08120 [Caulobacter sp. 32-67-35]